MARRGVRLVRRGSAVLLATLLAASGVGLAASPSVADSPGEAVLDLPFDGTLTDASSYANPVAVRPGGTARYTAGVSGQAIELNGSTALNLGTGAHLQPQDLTLSFWFRPSADMGTGEQVVAWSKTTYNSDGWYLSSENNNRPLALSIGPSDGQPYKVSVRTSRATFFPTNQWTHVVVVYDSETKDVAIYRNGVKQVTAVDYAPGGAATGVLGSESTSMKTLGFNGPQYNGAFLRGALDEYVLHDAVATTSDVVGLYREHVPSFDPAAVAQSDLDALSLPATAVTDTVALPARGAAGSEVTWAADSPHFVVGDDGVARITRPEGEAVDVTVTATATYGGSAPVSRTFVVTIPSVAGTSVYLESTELADVDVHDPYLANLAELNVEYLLSLDPAKFLYSWYVQAGLTPPTATGYGGWERATGTRFQGHFFGHYMTALAQAYAAETDPAVRQQLLDKLTVAVDGLAEVQAAYALRDPANAGYVAPFSTSVLPGGGNGLLVPFYNLHKVLAGLLDAYAYAPADVGGTALEVASGFGSWVNAYAGRLPNPGDVLRIEYGGMNEALYELFSITHEPVHKRAAEYFDEVTLFRQLAAGNDVLSGLHANTTIPKLVGALKRYTVFTDDPALYATLTDAEKAELDMYRAAAENFWQIVVDHHTYANGGNSYSEHFHAPDTLHDRATSGVTSGYGENSTSEGCNEYNMLKLTHELFRITKDAKYADFYETAYLNAVVSTASPETAMVTYFQPMTAGYAKVFGNPLDEFWCDHGTGVEKLSMLGSSYYFTSPTAVYVTQFRSSTFTDEAHNMVLTQTADIPSEDTATFTVEALDGGAVAAGTTVRLRVPDWVAGAPTLRVNGTVVDIPAERGFIPVPVEAGDEISYTLPAEVAVVADTENPNWVAFTYGPVLLAAPVSYENVGASYQAGVLVRMSTPHKDVVDSIVVEDAQAWKADIAANLVRIEDGTKPNGTPIMRFALRGVDPAAAGLVFEPYYSLYDARYAMYLNVVELDSEEAQASILAGKERLREAEVTIDQLTSFDNNNSEAGKNVQSNRSSVGTFNGQQFRHAEARADAWFSYDMTVDPDLEHNYLCVRYYGGDNGRTFGVYLNDVLLKTERITNAGGATSWYVQCDEIPRSVLDDPLEKVDSSGNPVLDEDGNPVPVVRVRFQGTGASNVGGVFGLSIRSATSFGTEAELSALTFDVGTLTPALTSGVHDYTLTVPAGTEAVALSASPALPSGLVRVGGVLVDDTLPRTIPLTGDTTTIALTAYAQDHETSVAYTVTVVTEDEPTGPAVSVTADTRCVAGKVVTAARVTNDSATPVEAVVSTPHGTRTVTVGEDRSTSVTFSTRAAAVGAGEVSVTATADGMIGSTTATAPYAARTCR
ncbi:beta-L-arabinofuranosidase domain-containing protein [Georgenia faecalis]|uniref:beta-L-arabinofuranosidase domain-containing protein n=1 Tax=Georgenia faecalis TaxID=2483799 RepID=UPI000FDB2FC0|nr:beta-L-arabinofuranosidase domain-containing protein [Georgenia faecalis]